MGIALGGDAIFSRSSFFVRTCFCRGTASTAEDFTGLRDLACSDGTSCSVLSTTRLVSPCSSTARFDISVALRPLGRIFVLTSASGSSIADLRTASFLAFFFVSTLDWKSNVSNPVVFLLRISLYNSRLVRVEAAEY